ncbi:hypothetical protein Bbelb_350550 [Branchiostoma belcheri]|nr:hypothetical protein Bbelb_350550 [Branchiostoma belcheri]
MKETGVPFRLCEGTGDDGKGSVKTWTQLNAKQLERVFAKINLKAVLQDRWSSRGLRVHSLSVAQLKAELRKHHLDDTGRKPVLVARLVTHFGTDEIQLSADSETHDENPILIVDNIIKLWRTRTPDSESFQTTGTATFVEHVTPYIHALVYHIPYFLDKYKYINDLSCESVEQKNHTQNGRFHQGSQKSGRGSMWTEQVMQYENRDLFAVLNGLDRKKAIMGPNSARRRAILQEEQQVEEEDSSEDEQQQREQEEEIFEEDDEDDS